MKQNVTVVDHPLVQHKLTLMRRKETPTAEFRQLARETSLLLAYEVTRDLPMTEKDIETPITKMRAPTLAGKKLCLITILRAGNGILEGMLDLMPVNGYLRRVRSGWPGGATKLGCVPSYRGSK